MAKSRAECFRLLGLPPSANEKEIKDAYRRKALELHPDKNPDDRESATERFQELQEAYNCLVNADEEDEDTISIYEWLQMMVIMRERERRRRQFQQMFGGLGGFFSPFVFDDDDDDGYYYHDPFFGGGYRRRNTYRQESHRFNHNRWDSDDFENYSNNRSSSRPSRNQYSGSEERKKHSCSGHDGNDNSSCSPEDWLPEQPKPSPTRSAKQKKKKSKKKKKKKEQGEQTVFRNINVTKNNGAEENDSDEESVTCTIDSVDNSVDSQEDDNYQGLSENEEFDEKTENCKTNVEGEDLKTENTNIYSEKEKKKQREFKNDEVKKDKERDSVNKNDKSTAGNGFESNNQAESSEVKMKVKVDNVADGTKNGNDTRSEPSDVRAGGCNNSQPANVNFENEERQNYGKTIKNTSNSQPSQKNSSPDGEYIGRNKIIDESLFMETKNEFYKEESDSVEELEDWNNWKFPTGEVNSTNKNKGPEMTKSANGGKGEKVPTNKGKTGEEVPKSSNGGQGEKVPTNKGKTGEEVPKSANGGKGEKVPTKKGKTGEEVQKSANGGKGEKVPTNKGKTGEEVPKSANGGKGEKVPNKGKTGEEVPKSTNAGKGEKVPKSTNKGKDGKEASKPTVFGENNVKLPKGEHSYQNGKTQFSHKDIRCESIKKKYNGFIKKHTDPASTKKYKKLIEITVI